MHGSGSFSSVFAQILENPSLYSYNGHAFFNLFVILIINRIKKLSISVVGRDIYNEIGITDGHDCYAGFWIMPAKTIYKEKTDEIENIYAIESNQISISYNNSNLYSGINYLLPFFLFLYDILPNTFIP